MNPPVTKSRYAFTTSRQNLAVKYIIADGPPPVTKVDMPSPLVDKICREVHSCRWTPTKKPHSHKLFICNCELTIINEKQYCYTVT